MNTFGTIGRTAIAVLSTCAMAQARQENRLVIRLDIPAPEDSAGGILVADVDADGRMEYLITVPGHVAAYANNGTNTFIDPWRNTGSTRL